MNIGDKLDDGWEVVDEMGTSTGTGFIVARPYSDERWAKKGVKEYAIVTEGMFRISFNQQRSLMKLILENIKGKAAYSFNPEKAAFQRTLDECRFTGDEK